MFKRLSEYEVPFTDDERSMAAVAAFPEIAIKRIAARKVLQTRESTPVIKALIDAIDHHDDETKADAFWVALGIGLDDVSLELAHFAIACGLYTTAGYDMMCLIGGVLRLDADFLQKVR